MIALYWHYMSVTKIRIIIDEHKSLFNFQKIGDRHLMSYTHFILKVNFLQDQIGSISVYEGYAQERILWQVKTA